MPTYTHDEKTGKKHHAGVPELADQLRQGKLDRREFLRATTLLGVSASAAYAMAGEITGQGALSRPARAETPKSGGRIRSSMPVQEMTDPATFSWVERSNISRHICEFMSCTGADNITRPYLAAGWEASDDLKTWTFNLQQGVKWSNGDDFNADDIVHNFTRWLDPETGSSNLGLFSAMTDEVEMSVNGETKKVKKMTEGAVEKIDDHTVKIHLNSPSLSLPENLYNYPTTIVHRGFGVDYDANLAQNPIGTGPYELAEYKIGQKASLKRRAGDYWGKDLDDPYIGGPVYLDEIQYVDHGSASAAQLAAFASGQVDSIYEFDIQSLSMAQAIPNSTIYQAKTAQTAVLRMQVDQPPFNNPDVRRALQLCMDVPKYNELVYQGRAVGAEHHHVAQIHPEYFELPTLAQNIEEAKALLEKAGMAGLEVTIDCGNTNGPWQQQVCEIFKEQAALAGVTVNINIMPSGQYWEVWDKTPFGITAWTHRPLGTMVLSLGYRKGVPWNETHLASDEFDAALTKAEALLDVDERRAAMEDVEKILQDSAVILQPLWVPKFFVASNKVKGMTAHPTQYHQYHRVWVDA